MPHPLLKKKTMQKRKCVACETKAEYYAYVHVVSAWSLNVLLVVSSLPPSLHSSMGVDPSSRVKVFKLNPPERGQTTLD